MIILQLSHGLHSYHRAILSFEFSEFHLGNFRRSTFKLKIQLLILMENLANQLVLVAKGILKLNDSKKDHRGIDHHLHRSQTRRCV
jgi:hypothetical protein